MTTSSTSAGAILARSSAVLMARPPSEAAENELSAPLKEPTAVRAAETITIFEEDMFEAPDEDIQKDEKLWLTHNKGASTPNQANSR